MTISLLISDGSLYGPTNGQYDIIIGSLNSTNMSVIAMIQNGTTRVEVINDMDVDVNGDVIVGGYTYGDWFDQNQGGSDVFLIKYDQDLSFIWGYQLGGDSYENIYSIDTDIFGDIWIGGDSSSSILYSSIAGPPDSFIAKYSSNGELFFGNHEDVSSSTIDQIRTVAVDNSNNLIFGGYTYGPVFSISKGLGDFYLGIYGCDDGYINVEAHCESTTFSPTFNPSFDPTFSPTFDPTFNPTSPIIYFDSLTHSLGVFYSQAYEPIDLNLNYSFSSSSHLFGSSTSSSFSNQDQFLISSPGVDDGMGGRGKVGILNDFTNFSSFQELDNYLLNSTNLNNQDLISSMDWISSFNSQSFIFYSIPSIQSVFMSEIVNGKIG